MCWGTIAWPGCRGGIGLRRPIPVHEGKIIVASDGFLDGGAGVGFILEGFDKFFLVNIG